jgi:hypothetical protein
MEVAGSKHSINAVDTRLELTCLDEVGEGRQVAGSRQGVSHAGGRQ